MLLFRSEEHLETWRSERDMPRGATLTLEQQWDLASAWYSGRLATDWRRRTPEEAEAAFAERGLTSDFWRLT